MKWVRDRLFTFYIVFVLIAAAALMIYLFSTRPFNVAIRESQVTQAFACWAVVWNLYVCGVQERVPNDLSDSL